MTITRDGDTIVNIEYTDKDIKRHFDRTSMTMEFDCYLFGEYVGTTKSHQDACEKLDALVCEQLRRAA